MNRGAQRLAALLSKHGSKKEFADQLGIEPSILSHWLKGDRRPTPQQRARIEDERGIGWRLWDEEIEAKGAA